VSYQYEMASWSRSFCSTRWIFVSVVDDISHRRHRSAIVQIVWYFIIIWLNKYIYIYIYIRYIYIDIWKKLRPLVRVYKGAKAEITNDSRRTRWRRRRRRRLYSTRAFRRMQSGAAHTGSSSGASVAVMV